MLLHLVDVLPPDESDPAENVLIIEKELEQYAQDLYQKPRFLALNKCDLISDDEAAQLLERILSRMEVKPERTFIISALNQTAVQELVFALQELVDRVKSEQAATQSDPQAQSTTFVWTEPEPEFKDKSAQKEAAADEDGPEFIYQH